MTKLSWGTPGERYYETGVEKGVLYVDDVGYAWNGLISVQQKSAGGELTPHYLDGFKYAETISNEEFDGSIEAYSAPTAFGVCDGTLTLAPGLSATRQPHKRFGLSYKTLVGNDVDGLTHSYKIHLIYNARASASEKNNPTVADSVEPLTFNWPITAVPNSSSFFRPTAHFIVESATCDPVRLAALEAKLYGTDAILPYLPTIAEVIMTLAPQVVIPPAVVPDPVIGTVSDFATTGSVSWLGPVALTLAPLTTLLLVFAGKGGTVTGLTDVTYNAVSLLKLDVSASPSSSTGREIEVWYMINPPTGASYSLIQKNASGSYQRLSAVAVSNTGSYPFTTVGKAAAATGTSVACSAGAGANVYVGAVLLGGTDLPVYSGGDTTIGVPDVSNAAMPWKTMSSTDPNLAATWATSQPNAAVILGLIGGTTAPPTGSNLPLAMPTGSILSNGVTYNPIWSEDFNTDAVLGTFTNVNSSSGALATPAAYVNSINAYPYNWGDTDWKINGNGTVPWRGGVYHPAKTMSVSGGQLHLHLWTEGANTHPWVAAPGPKLPSTLLYGRTAIHFRVPHGSNSMKLAWLLWPDDDQWPLHGEIDFPEMKLAGNVEAFHHYARAPQEPHQDAYSVSVNPSVDGLWHTATVDWQPGHIYFTLDGALVGHSTLYVPTTPMHWVWQSESRLDGNTVVPGETADIDIAWAVVYQ